jgi:hypothetical protein
MSATVSHLARKRALWAHSDSVVALYLSAVGESFNKYVCGWCGPLTYNVSQWLSDKQLKHQRLMITRAVEEGNSLYPSVKNQPETIWYHAIIALDGIVHCPWLDERLTVDAYCAKMFPGQRVTIEEDYNCCTTMMWREAA